MSAQANSGRKEPDGPTSRDPGPDESQYAVLDRKRTIAALDWGGLAAIAVALAYGLLWGAAALQWGLIAVAIMFGWLIGAAVRRGAWRGLAHAAAPKLQALGAALGALAWFGGALVAYLSSRALLQSDLPLDERFTSLPFWEYLAEQYMAAGVVHVLGLAALAIMGWRTAR